MEEKKHKKVISDGSVGGKSELIAQALGDANSVRPADLVEIQDRFSPLRFLIILIAGIFLAEVAAMIIIFALDPMPYQYLTLLDASIMVVLIFPLVYYFSLRPLIDHINRRRRAEEQVREMALFPALNPDAVLQVDSNGLIKKTNPAAVQMGLSLGAQLTDLIPDFCDLDFPTCIAEGTTKRVYETHLGKSILKWTIRGAPELELAFLFSEDITVRKQTELALLRSTELQNRFFDSIEILIAYMDRDFNFIRVNEAYAKSDGHSTEYFVGKNHFELFPHEENQAIFQRVVETREAFSVNEKAFEYPEHLTYWNWALHPVMGEGGVVDGVVLSLLDVTERRRAEDKNRQLSRIVEQTTDTVVVTDREGLIEYVNPAFEQMTGYTKDEVLGKTPRVLKSGLHNDQFYKELWNTILSGKAFQGEIANCTKNGDLFYEEKTITPLRDAQGNNTHFVATGKDTTERKHSEEKLRQAYDELELRVQDRTEELRIANSELEEEINDRKRAEAALRKAHDELELRVRERTRELALANKELLQEIAEREEVERQLRVQTTAMKAAANGIVITDTRGKILWTNPALSHMSGYDEDELIGKTMRVFQSGEQSSEYYRQMWTTIQSGQVWKGEINNRHKDGSQYIEDQTITPVRGEHGELSHFIAIKQDITEQKQIAAALELERARLKNILDTIPDGVYIINQEYEIEYINPVIEREFGSIGGQKCFAYFHDRENPCPWCKNEEVFTGKPLKGEHTYAKNNKSYEIFDAPLANSDGSVSKLKLLHDITQRKEMELELERSNQELQATSNAERRHRQLAEALVEAALVLNRSLELDEVLTIILEQIRQVIPYQFADIGLLDGNSFYDASHQGDADIPATQMGVMKRYTLDEFPLLQEMCQSGQPVLIPDTELEPDWNNIESFEWCRSFLSAPLIVEKRVIGFVNLFARQADFFTQDLCDRLVAFASHAAVAIQNAWLFEQVRSSSEHLQSLSRRLVEVQENERLYIARELHDEAGQLLTSLLVDLQLLEKEANKPKAILKIVEEMESSLNAVSENLHRVAMALRPASLDHVGLIAALRQHVESIGEKNGLMVSFRSKDFQERLPANVETVLYRIVQESLTNVVRHAQASRADVVLTVRNDKLVVIVEDDGIGFDPNSVSSGEHLGLFGMRERAEMIEGNLVIESMPGKGTTIIVEVDYVDTNIGR